MRFKLGKKGFLFLSVAVALLIGAIVSAQVGVGTWLMYTSARGDPGRAFESQAEAAAYYIQDLSRVNDPTKSSRCWRMYWNNSANELYTDVRWANGVMTVGCAWPSPEGSTADKSFGITNVIACTTSSTDERCTQPLLLSNSKNAGPPCDDPCGGPKYGPRPEGTVAVGNPINVGTGNKYQVDTDFTVPGSPWLNFSRYYNSQPSRAIGVSMGIRWRHSFDYALRVNSSNVMFFHRPDGSIREFNTLTTPDPDTQGYVDYILDDSGDVVGYTLHDDNGRVETYTKEGAITRIDFREGGFIQYTYPAGASLRPSQVTDHFGRTLTFTYDSLSRITQVTTPGGAVYAYTYDNYDRLTKRTAPGGQVRTYGYDASGANPTTAQRGLLTSITDETGVIVGKYYYEKSSRAIRTEGAAGINKYLVAYGSGTATVTSPLGAVTSMTVNPVLRVPRITASTTTCTAGACVAPGSTSSVFDVSGNLVAHVADDGSKSCMSYDTSRNLLTVRVDNLPASADCGAALYSTSLALPAVRTEVEWHPYYRLPLTMSTAKQTQSFSYDTLGRLLAVTTQATLDPTGVQGLQAPPDGAPRTRSFAYNQFGQVVAQTGPRTDISDVTTYAYGAAGVLTSMTDPAGLVTSFSMHDADGRPGRVTLPSGVAVDLGYDARGRLTQNRRASLVVHGGVSGGLLNKSCCS